MPICRWCRKDKPDKDFRLVKKHVYGVAYLIDICKKCEQPKPSKSCYRCGKPDLYGCDTFKESARIYFCKACHKEAERLRKIIRKLRAEKRLNRLIKILAKMGNSIDGLRDHLFATIEGLRDGSITIDVASKIADVAVVIIDSARAENEYIQLTKSAGSGFIPLKENNLRAIEK